MSDIEKEEIIRLYTEKEMLENCISFGEHIQKELSEVSGQSFKFNLVGELKIWFDKTNRRIEFNEK